MNDEHFEVGEFARIMGPTAAEAAAANAAGETVDDKESDDPYIKDDVDALTDLRTLDEAIAREVFQFHLGTMVVGSDGSEGSGHTYPQWWGKHHILDSHRVSAQIAINVPIEWGMPRIWSQDGLPRFSSDPIAALSLFARFQRGGWGGALIFDGHVFGKDFNASFGAHAEATEANPAEAIARAALRAIRAANRGRDSGTMGRGVAVPEGPEGDELP